MVSHTGQAFIVYVESPVCNCEAPRKVLSTHKVLERAIPVAQAHWSLYVTFYGELTHWFDIIIVDTRDGVMVWRNGRPLKEGKSDDKVTNQDGRRRGDIT